MPLLPLYNSFVMATPEILLSSQRMEFPIFATDVERLNFCPLCAGNLRNISSVLIRGDIIFFSTSMCERCCHICRETRPTKQWFSEAFQRRERFQQGAGISAINPEIEADRYQRYSQVGSALNLPIGTTLLDIGCGPGTGLKALMNLGYKVLGVEEDATRADHGINLGYPIAKSQWEQFEPQQRFNVITCLHSLEHFHEPEQLLRKLVDWLDPAGKIVVEVPNFCHFVQDWTDSLYLAHMANYTPMTLSRLGENVGLRVIARLHHYDSVARNDENLCLVFERGRDSLPQNEVSTWDEAVSKYAHGLETAASPPYTFEVPAINDISLCYKNSSRISSALRENLHMRTVRRQNERFVVS